MPTPRTSIHQRLSNSVTVITANQRLARELRQQFDRQQVADGKLAWESADVLPYAAWLPRTWQQLHDLHSLAAGESPAPPAPPLLLNDAQLVAVWERIIRDDISRRARLASAEISGISTEPLWNPYATAKSAVAAWQLCHQWDIALRQATASNQPDHRCLRRWANQFEQLCANRNWLDRHRLAARVMELLAALETRSETKPQTEPATDLARIFGQLELVGFDQLLPQQQALVTALQRAHIEITVTAPPAPSQQKIEFHSYPDAASQWLSAAQWAREQHTQNPQMRLAIIAPDMHQAAPAVEYALRQTLSPQQLVAPAVSAQLPYHLSLGDPLSQYPLVKAALVALAPLANQPLRSDALCQLVRSPFVRGAEREAMPRAQLERRLRAQLPYQIGFADFLKQLPQAEKSCPCPRLTALLQSAWAAHEKNNPRRKKRFISHWMKTFSEWLETLGWLGERALDSDEYQTVEAVREQLRYLATLDLTTPPIAAATALSWLQRRLQEQTFQVEAHSAAAVQVQVLGILEAAGQQFDGLWFGDLVDRDWPPQVRPTPFLAPAAQRLAGVFAASTEHNYAHAARLQQRLIAASKHAVLSYPRQEDDIATVPSPLFAECAKNAGGAATAHHEPPYSFATPANIVHAQRPKLTEFVDACGPKFPPHARAKGGSSLLKNQAQCPFRAFAVHRLAAQEQALDANAQGLDAAQRGSLLHHALQLVWQKIQRSQKLRALAEQQLHEIVHAAVTTASARYQLISGCGAQFAETQNQWAQAVVREWLQVEQQREVAFSVQALEQRISFTLHGLELNLSIDRIDVCETGARTLIDYKTGAQTSVSGWRGARLQDPQLPLYAIALMDADADHHHHANANQPIETLAFARLKAGQCKYIGITNHHHVTANPPFTPLAEQRALKAEFADWQAMLTHWRHALANLATEFLQGQARVDPLLNACKFCQLDGLCRIDKSKQVALAEVEEGGESAEAAEFGEATRADSRP